MSMNHLPRQDLALYVLGALEPAQAARLEAHVAACPSCADALADEAQLEVKLQALVPAALRELPSLPVAVRPLPMVAEPPALRRRWPLMTMLAASLALIVGLTLSRPGPPLPSPSGAGEESLAALSIVSASESFSEWPPEAGPLQSRLPGGGLLCQPQPPEPPAVLREVSFSTAADWMPLESAEGLPPINSVCYAPN